MSKLSHSLPWHVPPLAHLDCLQGSPSSLCNDIQLMLLIQPNCPGCHIHAIPAANQLAAMNRQDVAGATGFDIYIISTAFEDFEHNTRETTIKLLHNGELVGEAKKQLGPTAKHIPSKNLLVAYDIVTNKCDLSPPDLKAASCAARDNAREQMMRSQSMNFPPVVLEQMLDKMDPNTLLPEKVAKTFWSVRGAGTPMWVIHRRSSGEVLDRMFGHSTVDDILLWMQPHLR